MKLLDQSQLYLLKGFSITPVKLEYDKEKKGKVNKPATVQWKKYQKEKPTNTVLLTEWKNKLQDRPGIGIAVITGEISDLVVVDIDNEESLKKIKPYIKGIKTVVVRTPGNGYHFYFRYTEGFDTIAGLGGVGLDIRSNGGYVVAPPSQYPDGIQYKYLPGYELGNVDIIPMPGELKEFLMGLRQFKGGKSSTSKKKTNNAWFLEAMKGVGDGQRTDIAVKIVGYLFRQNLSPEVIIATILAWNQQNRPPEKESILIKQVESTLRNIGEGKVEDIIERLNEKYGLIDINGTIAILKKYKDYEGRDQIAFQKPEAFKLQHVNQKIRVNKKPESIANLWLEHKERKDYHGIIFDPSKKAFGEDEGYYNVWRGFSYSPKKGSWEIFKNHIKNNIAREHTPWIMAWMARIIQDPGGRRPGTVLCLRGGQGVGKSIFCDTFGKLFGQHYTVIDSVEKVTSRFNSALMETVLLSIDDATWGGDRKHAGQLRSMITSESRMTERKYMEPFPVKSHINVLISSNESWMIPAGLRERRFLVLDIDNTYQGNTDYFHSMVEEMENGGYEAMMNDLLEYDISKFNLRKIPKTIGTEEQVIGGLSIIGKFWLSRLEQGTLVDSHLFWKFVVVKQKLYEQYKYFCQERQLSRTIVNESIFVKEIRRFCPELKRGRRRAGSKKLYKVHEVPRLKKVRELFSTSTGHKIDWESLEEDRSITLKDRQKDLPGTFRNSEEF